jgi:hypothetical protein
VIEVKAGTDTNGIKWAPAQVSFYARLFEHWIKNDPASAHSTLTAMIADRAGLGLAPKASLKSPIQVVPVIALGWPLTNEVAAKQGATTLQKALLASGTGYPNLEVWAVQPDGSHTTIDWF